MPLPTRMSAASSTVMSSPRTCSFPSSGDQPAKLADFGGARLAGEEALTKAGDVLGTLAYMAPEQSDGGRTDGQSDLYSLALVLYEALCGVNPMRGPTPAATARRIGKPLPPLARHRRDLDRGLTRAIDTALSVAPARRGTLAQLHGSLVAALELDRPRTAGQVALPVRQAAHPARVAHPARQSNQPSHPGSTPLTDDPFSEESTKRSRQERFALPRVLWLLLAGSLILWQALAGRAGLAVLLLAAAAPLAALPRRSGPGWLAAALAPLLGLAGLAGAFPALASQRRSWRARAFVGALGYWWLILAEPLAGRTLWLGPPPGLPARAAWESSFGRSLHVLSPLLVIGVLMGACLWALACVLLPWIVRGHSVLVDLFAAAAWSAGLLAAAPLIDRGLPLGSGSGAPRGAVVGSILAALIAVAARALRGPSPRRSATRR